MDKMSVVNEDYFSENVLNSLENVKKAKTFVLEDTRLICWGIVFDNTYICFVFEFFDRYI